MSTKDRLNKLERAIPAPTRTYFFWRDGPELNAKQKAEVDEAEARGDSVMIFGWPPENETLRPANIETGSERPS